MTRLIRIISAAVIISSTLQLMADSQERVLKVAITASGRISADGRPTTLERLIPMLRELAKNKGEVWYYREAPKADPHPNSMKVLEAIVDQNLPIRLSTTPDYSVFVDDKGRPILPH